MWGEGIAEYGMDDKEISLKLFLQFCKERACSTLCLAPSWVNYSSKNQPLFEFSEVFPGCQRALKARKDSQATSMMLAIARFIFPQDDSWACIHLLFSMSHVLQMSPCFHSAWPVFCLGASRNNQQIDGLLKAPSLSFTVNSFHE